MVANTVRIHTAVTVLAPSIILPTILSNTPASIITPKNMIANVNIAALLTCPFNPVVTQLDKSSNVGCIIAAKIIGITIIGIDGVNLPDTKTAVKINIIANPRIAYIVTLIKLPPHLFLLLLLSRARNFYIHYYTQRKS